MRVLKNFEEQLQIKKGNYLCGKEDSEQISFGAFKESLKKDAEKFNDAKLYKKINELESKIIELLNDQSTN